MLPTLESLILLRGAKQPADLDLSDISKESGIGENALRSNPALFMEAVVTYFDDGLKDSVDKPKAKISE